MLYFNQKEYFPKNAEEIKQQLYVFEFKDNLPKEGFSWNYNGLEQFKELVYRHITKYIQNKFKTESTLTDESILSNQEIEKILNNYTNSLKKKVSKIRRVGDNFEHEPEVVFTQLQIIKPNQQRREDKNLIGLEIRKKLNPFDFQDDESDEKRDKVKKMIKPEDLLRSSNKGIIIVGSSGSGKSTILHYLTFKTLQQNERFPIYLELKSILKDGFPNVKNFEDIIFSRVISPLRLKDKEQEKKITLLLNDKFQDGKVAFFLDGLDEISETINSNTFIHEMFEDFMEYSIDQNNLVIITTRPSAQKNVSPRYPVEEIEIVPFNMEQIKQFVDYQYHEYPDATKFLDEISTRYELQEIAKTPLVLSFIAQIYFNDIKLSKNKLDLYGQIINNLDDSMRRRDFLSHLAFRSLFNFKKNFDNRLVFTSEELFNEVDAYCNDRPNLQINTDNFFVSVKKSLLLGQIDVDKYSFIHLTFQEYLAAKILSSHQNITELFCKAYSDPTLCEKEVLPMTLGFTSNNDNNTNNENLYEILEQLPESLNFANLRIRARGLRYAIKIGEKYLSSMTNRLIEFLTNSNIGQISYKEIILHDFSGLSEGNGKFISDRLLKLLKTHDQQLVTSFPINNIIYALGQLRAKRAIHELIALVKVKYEDSGVRSAAISALCDLYGKEAIPELIALLKVKEEDSGVRSAAISALERLQAKEAIPELIALLKVKEDSGVRSAAASTLGHLKAKEAIPELIALLKDKHSRVYLEAASSLCNILAKEAIPELIMLLKDENYVSDAVAGVLRKLQTEETILSELIALTKDENYVVRCYVAIVLGGLQTKEAIPELIALLKDKNYVVRFEAAYALGRLQTKEAIPELIALLKDKNYVVRFGAAYALGWLQAKEAIPELIALLKDKNEEVGVRSAAVYALGDINAKEAIPELIALLKDKNEDSRYAVSTLVRLQAKEVVSELITMLKDEHSGVRIFAVSSLRRLQAKEAIPELIALLKDEDFDVRRAAVSTLGYLKAKEAIPELMFMLKDKNENFDVRRAAVSTLGYLKAKEAIPELIALLEDNDSRVRRAAASALGQYDLDMLVDGIFLGLLHDITFVRKKSISIIGYYSNEQAEKKLQEIIKNDQNEEIKILAKTELEKLQYKMQMIS
jgi:HEAT repeat protein